MHALPQRQRRIKAPRFNPHSNPVTTHSPMRTSSMYARDDEEEEANKNNKRRTQGQVEEGRADTHHTRQERAVLVMYS